MHSRTLHITERSARAACPLLLLLFIGAVALVTNSFSLLGARLWVYPDSIDYVQLAGGIADRLDLSNELFLVRTPGYPLLLAAIFRAFGQHSPVVILVLQHLMVVAVALCSAAIAWRLTSRTGVALLTGVLCACSLQILAYANLVLTEAPFALTLVLCVYALIRFQEEGRGRWLGLASLLAGVGYLLRPVSLYLLPICVAVGLWRSWEGRLPATAPRLLRQASAHLAFSLVPALVIAAPWMALSTWSHRSLQATRCLDYMYYLRAATFDGLDSTQSEAMRDIHSVIHQAQAAGQLPKTADYRDRATVIKAYQAVRGIPFAQSSAILGQAGRDLMNEHRWEILVGTFKYAGWMILSPDPVYRFHPGAAPGIGGRRDPHAELYDTATYAFGDGSWEQVLTQYRHYLPLSAEPTFLTPLASEASRQFYRHVENGEPILGIGDSRYEFWALLCVLGGAASLLHRARAGWVTVFAVLSLHVLLSAFLSGPQTRYAMPVRPFLCLYAAIALIVVPSQLLIVVRGAIGRLEPWGSQAPRPAAVVAVVTVLAVVVEGVALSASHLWVVPTSLEYLELAREVAEHGDFSNELFLLRTPGYPAFLAIVFRIFGGHSAAAIFILQHAMTVAIAPLVALTAWHVSRRTSMALLAGVLAACSLQVIAFAGQIMTETPYTLALVACVYLLVRYHRQGGPWTLAWASGLAGIAYLLRPMGLTLIVVLSAVALGRTWSSTRIHCARSRWRPVLSAQLAAITPMALMVVAWWAHNQVVYGANSFGRTFDFALYNRAANVERASGKPNEQFTQIDDIVARAKSEGLIDADADEGMAWTVWQAQRAVEGTPLRSSSELLGSAARKKLLDDPWGILWGTAKYSAWMLLTPDSSYRYQPDGAPAVDGRRNAAEEIFDSAMYLDALQAPLQSYADYLVLGRGPRAATSLWSGVNRWFARHVEHGAPLVGIGDSLHEELVLACLLAGGLSLFTNNRGAWLIIIAVVSLQIVPSAFVAGIGPRYAVPIQPFMKLFAASAIMGAVVLPVLALHTVRQFFATRGTRPAWTPRSPALRHPAIKAASHR